MSQPWHSLFVPRAEAEPVAAALRALLEADGFRAYDPFPGGMGTPPALRDMVRAFVAPPADGWVRVVGEVPADVIPALSGRLGAAVIAGWLTDEGGGFALYQDGARHDDPAAFAALLKPGRSPDLLARAFAGELPVPAVDPEQPSVVAVGLDALPPKLQARAQDKHIDADKAAKMFDRVSGNLFRKVGGGEDREEQARARELVMGQGHDRWNSLAGQKVRAVAEVLDLPPNWRLPTLETVRDAYQVHRLRERAPRMALMPGDKETMQAVPDALAYLPIYFGRT